MDSSDIEATRALPYSDLWLSTDHDLQAAVWSGETGAAWAERNPADVAGTNKSWRTRFGIDKVSVIREAAHGVSRDATWLEVGCSSGAHMRCMRAAGFGPIVGCDVNREALALCDAAVQADARHLPFASGSVDGVTTSGSLMHLGPDERMAACLLEMTRVARRWLFFIELYHQSGQLVTFGHLLPPAWVMPWGPWLAARLPDGWEVRRFRVVRSIAGGNAQPLCTILVQKVL